MGIITVFHFRDYYYPPISGIIPPPPCDVINTIKQNSSDMNEIIPTPCDAGYVQSCTGLNNI
jgi:hypothetical protein